MAQQPVPAAAPSTAAPPAVPTTAPSTTAPQAVPAIAPSLTAPQTVPTTAASPKRPKSTRSPVRRPSTATVKKDKKWTRGDFTLISSDNVAFRVESFYLYAASGVFRKGQTMASPHLRVEFTDEDFETAQVIRHFLDLVVHGKMSISPDNGKLWCNLEPFLNLLRFLLKYSCEVHLQLFNCWIKACDDVAPDIAFIIAALQDDTKWCSKLVKDDGWKHDSSMNTSLDSGVAESSVLDPRGAPMWFWKVVPHPYIWALSRAWTAVPSEDEGEARAAQFEKFMAFANGLSESDSE